MEHVLITGGSGTIGSELTSLLHQEGFEVAWLSRTGGDTPVKQYVWDIEKGKFDREAIAWADHIIHLAGADIAEKPWTEQRKRVIYDSRVKSAQLLSKAIHAQQKRLHTFLSVSGVGYYGSGGDQWQTEDTPPASGFVASICVDWEAAVKPVADTGARVAIFRTPPVLTKQGGLLEPFKLPMKLGIGPYFGNGKQFYSWIHVSDLCRIFLHALKNEFVEGVYNASAPDPIRNKQFVKEVARGFGKKVLLVPVPQIALSLTMGKRGKLPFDSNRVSAKRLVDSGFTFRHVEVQAAVSDLFS